MTKTVQEASGHKGNSFGGWLRGEEKSYTAEIHREIHVGIDKRSKNERNIA